MSCFCSFYVIFGTLFKGLSFRFVTKWFSFVPGTDTRNIRRISAISHCPVPSIQIKEQPNVTRQYVSSLERGVTGLLSQHSSTCAKSRIPAPTTFCWTNGQVPTRCSMPGSISSRMSKRRRSWTPSKTSHSLRNCPGSKKTSALKTEAVCFVPCSLY